MIIRAEDAQKIVTEMKNTVGRDVNFMNEEGVIIASTNLSRIGQIHQGARRLLLSGMNRLDCTESDPAQGVQRGINLAVCVEGKTEGVVGITGDPRELSDLGSVIQKMTEIMISASRNQAEEELLEQARNLFLENWLQSEAVDEEDLVQRGSLLGIDCRIPRLGVVLKITAREGPARMEDAREVQNVRFLPVIRKRIRFDRQNFCTVWRNRIVILFAGATVQEVQEHTARICEEISGFYGNQVHAGIGTAAARPQELSRCCALARAACDLAVRTGKEIQRCDALSLPLLVQTVSPAMAEELIRQVLGDCSPEECRELLDTVRLYFEAEGDTDAAARQLFVHRNTFQYHVDRVKKKTGLSLRRPTDLVKLYLVLQLYSREQA